MILILNRSNGFTIRRPQINSVLELADKKLWLAPLAGYTDQPFRRICRLWGADVVVSEMVSAEGLIRKQQRTIAYLSFTREERPFGVQLFGHNPTTMASAAGAVLKYHPDFIDVNMGCPVKKVIKRGAGGALMADLPRAAEIVKSIRSVIPKDFPLSVKFRSGPDQGNLNYLEFGLAMQDAGADMVVFHPRTVKQGFTGTSNWQHLTELKKRLLIPVIGNGDIRTVESALDLYLKTNCNSIMLGRATLGQPWIFAQIKNRLEVRSRADISQANKLMTVLRHLDYALQIKSERIVVRELRSQLCHYTRGLPGSAALRVSLNQAESADEIKKILTDAFAVI